MNLKNNVIFRRVSLISIFPKGNIYLRDNNMLDNNLRAYFNVNPSSSMRFLSRSTHSMTGSIKTASLSLISASKYVYVLDIGSKSWKFKKLFIVV